MDAPLIPQASHRVIPKLLIAIAVGFGLALAILMLTPENALALDENNCLSCHSNSDFFKTNDQGNKVSLYVDEQHVNTSAHRFIDWTIVRTHHPPTFATP